MSSGLAAFFGLAIYAAALLPIAWMALQPASARWLGWLCAALVVGLAMMQTGIFNQGALATTQVDQLIQAETAAGRCGEVMDALSDNGILLEPPGPEGLVVNGEAWRQLPPPIIDAIVACAETSENVEEIQVIQR